MPGHYGFCVRGGAIRSGKCREALGGRNYWGEALFQGTQPAPRRANCSLDRLTEADGFAPISDSGWQKENLLRDLERWRPGSKNHFLIGVVPQSVTETAGSSLGTETHSGWLPGFARDKTRRLKLDPRAVCSPAKQQRVCQFVSFQLHYAANLSFRSMPRGDLNHGPL